MKLSKFTLAAATLIGCGVAGNAQETQLPNNGFETWVDCVPWNSSHTTTKQGKTPEGWCVSSVVTPGMSAGNQTVGESVTGKNGNAARVFNKGVVGQTIPGYITLGTTWATARVKSTSPMAGSADGGTWGGLNFTCRPDAVAFDYKRTNGSGSTQPATAVAYLWKGQTIQKNVPANNTYKLIGTPAEATVEDMNNRERNILGIAADLGGDITKSSDFELIANFEHKITSPASDWTNIEIPFAYKSNSTPEMINIILSASDYFADRSTLKGDDELIVDNVKLVYYSRLKNLTVSGESLSNFDSKKYDYSLETTYSPDLEIVPEVMGQTATYKVTMNDADYTATISVTNVDADSDGQKEHTYTIRFAEPKPAVPTYLSPAETNNYTGKITIIGIEETPQELPVDYTVNITNVGFGHCNFSLKDFSMDGTTIMGDIDVTKVKTYVLNETDDVLHFDGAAKDITLTLEGSEIVADVTIEGTKDSGDKLDMIIHVIWKMDATTSFPFDVTFNGNVIAKPVINTEYRVFEGGLAINMEGTQMDPEGTFDVHITPTEAGLCDFTLKNFALGADAVFGDINVSGVKVYGPETRAAVDTRFFGSQKNVSLAEGAILADVVVEGTKDSDHNLNMNIHVNWLTDPENDPTHENFTPIEVAYNGKYNDVKTSIIDNILTAEDAPARYYNIDGVEIAEPTAAGIYIVRRGNKVEKIVKK